MSVPDKKSTLERFRNAVFFTAAIILVFGSMFIGLTWRTETATIRHLAANLLAAYFLAWGSAALLSAVPREELRTRFLLTTAILVGCIGLAEAPVLMHLVDYRTVFKTPIHEMYKKPANLIDEELLWVHKPHSRVQGTYTNGELGAKLCATPGPPQEYDLRYDQHGFRNETDLSAADIAVIGDSFIEGEMVPQGQLMTSVLERLQHKTVANLGGSGYAPQQELVVLKRYALALHPKTIVWVFFEGNDGLGAYYFDEAVASIRQEAPRVNAAWARSFSRNALSALLRLAQGCTPVPGLGDRYVVVQNQDGQEQKIYFFYPNISHATAVLSPRELEGLRKTVTILETAARLCRERGIRFVVLFAPMKYRVYAGLSNVVRVSEEVQQWALNDYPEQLGRLLAEVAADSTYLDLTPVLRANTEKGILAFWPDDPHWAPEGHRIVAEAVDRVLSVP